MGDEPSIRRRLRSPIVGRIVTTFELCAVVAGVTELYFGGPGIFVGGMVLGTIGLTIGFLTKPWATKRRAISGGDNLACSAFGLSERDGCSSLSPLLSSLHSASYWPGDGATIRTVCRARGRGSLRSTSAVRRWGKWSTSRPIRRSVKSRLRSGTACQWSR